MAVRQDEKAYPLRLSIENDKFLREQKDKTKISVNLHINQLVDKARKNNKNG
jgi:hypothetical protein